MSSVSTVSVSSGTGTYIPRTRPTVAARARLAYDEAMRGALALVVTLILGACAHETVTFQASSIHAATLQLRAEGRALVPAADGTARELAIDDELALATGDAFERGTVPVAEIIRSCTDPATDRARRPGPDEPRCPLLSGRDYTREDVDTGATASTWAAVAIALGVIGGLGTCAAVCDDPWNYVSGATLGVLLTTTLVVAVALLTGTMPAR